MAQRKIVTVSVTAEQDAFIRGRVNSGRFGSVSEVVRAGLRLLEREEVWEPSSSNPGTRQGPTAVKP